VIELTGEPNQVVPVPGVGTLTLGESKIKEGANSASASITAVVLRFNDSNTVVRIGHAQARVDNAINALFGGGAYGTTVEVAGTITSGKTANQPIRCAGTQGKLKVNELAGVNLDGLGTASGIRSAVRTRQGTPPDSFPEAHATNTIDSVSLSGGLVTLTGVQTRVNVYEKANGNERVHDRRAHRRRSRGHRAAARWFARRSRRRHAVLLRGRGAKGWARRRHHRGPARGRR